MKIPVCNEHALRRLKQIRFLKQTETTFGVSFKMLPVFQTQMLSIRPRRCSLC